MTVNCFQAIIDTLRTQPKRTIAVAAAQDDDVLLSVGRAKTLGLAEAVLVGDASAIVSHLENIGMDPDDFHIINQRDPLKAAETAVGLVGRGEAHLLMKGLLGTADILKAVLNKDAGLRTGDLLSHVTVFEAPDREGLMLMTDAGMNMAPDLMQKVALINNAAATARVLGIERPRVAPIAAVELVNPEMQATMDAALLTQMAARGQIKGVVIDGPLALDNAVSPAAARHKGITGPVAGCADILLMPNIEAGNVFYKTLAYFTETKMAGIITGARVPVILTSRADTADTKLHSIALACFLGKEHA